MNNSWICCGFLVKTLGSADYTFPTGRGRGRSLMGGGAEAATLSLASFSSTAFLHNMPAGQYTHGLLIALHYSYIYLLHVHCGGIF